MKAFWNRCIKGPPLRVKPDPPCFGLVSISALLATMHIGLRARRRRGG